MIYQGSTTTLYTLPKDDLQIMPSRLGILRRSYACASSYASTARTTLAVGSAPSGYSYFSLYDRPEQTENGITVFNATYYGVLSTSDYDQPYVTRGTRLQTVSTNSTGTISGTPSYTVQTATEKTYRVPIYTRRYVLASGTQTTQSPPTASTILNGETIYILAATDNVSSSSSTGTTSHSVSPNSSTGTDSGLTASDLTVMLENSTTQDWGSVTEVTETWGLSWSTTAG